MKEDPTYEQLIHEWLDHSDTPEKELKAFDQFELDQKISIAVKELYKPQPVDFERINEIYQTPKARTINKPYYLLAVAAAIVILVMGVLYTPINYNVHHYDDKNTTTLALTKEVKANLMPLSKITTNQTLLDKHQVFELEGSSYFNVTKGTPVIIHTSQGEVEVLGTTFEVIDRLGVFTVRCFTGKVAVTQGDQHIVITAGQLVELTGGQLNRSSLNNLHTVLWEKQEIVFNNAPLSYVAKQWSLRTGQKMSTTKEVQQRTFTGNLPLDAGMKTLNNYLAKPLNVQLKKTNKGIVIAE